MTTIRHIRYHKIDRKAWTRCIDSAPNGRIYSLPWYLDLVTNNQWDALIIGDYEAVLPLPYHRKFLGWKTVYPPLLCQQLGYTGAALPDITSLSVCLDAIPKLEYRKVSFTLNDACPQGDIHGWTRTTHTNLMLWLDQAYDTLKKNYSTQLNRNLQKAAKSPLLVTDHLDTDVFIDHIKAYHHSSGNKIPAHVYSMARAIIHEAIKNQQGFYRVATTTDGQWCAAIFFLNYGDRIIDLLNVSTAEGRERQAMSFLLDAVIKTHAEQPRWLDFEGSSIPGVARFYQGFGAINQPYSTVLR